MALNYDALKNKQARRTTQGWTPKEGDNILRIFPHTQRYFTESLDDFAIEFRSHFLKAEGMDTEVVRCLRDSKVPCGFCEAYKKIKDAADPAVKKIADQLKSSERHLLNVMNLNDAAAGMQVFECGPKVYDGFLSYVANPSWGEVLHPEVGRNFTLKLTPQGKTRSGFNEYHVEPHPQNTSILPNLTADWLEKLDRLADSVPKYPDDAQVAKWLKVLGLDGSAPAPGVPPAPVPVPFVPPSVAVAPPPMAQAAVVPQMPSQVPAPIPTAPAPVAVAPPSPSVTAVPMAPPPVPPPVTASVPAAPGMVSGSPGPLGNSEVATFVATYAPVYPITVLMKAGAPKKYPEVPSCFSEGMGAGGALANPNVGFNPQRWPCEKGCPVKADCQIRQLGLG